MISDSARKAFDAVVDRRNASAVKWNGSGMRVAASVADMEFAGPEPVLTAVAERVRFGALGYTTVSPSSYGAIGDWYRDIHKISVNESNVVQFPFGPKGALRVVGRSLLKSDDAVVVPTPTYRDLIRVVEAAGATCIEWPLIANHGGMELDVAALEKIVETHQPTAMLICNPNNPTGIAFKTENLRSALAVLCGCQNFRLVISDEVHGDLVYSHVEHSSILRHVLPAKVAVVAISSIGKTFNLSGLNTSYCIASPAGCYNSIRDKLRAEGLYEGSLIGDVATTAALSNGRQWRDDLVNYLQESAQLTVRTVETEVAGMKVLVPTASFLLCVDYSDTCIPTEQVLRSGFEEAGISVQYASRFGSKNGRFFRYNFATSHAQLLSDLEYLVQTVKRLEDAAQSL